jgi:hypothetical protein
VIQKRLAIAILAVLVSAITLLARTSMVPAQERPSLPPGPQPMPRLPLGSPGGSGAYVISAAANEHGSFVWIVDSI